MPKNAATIISYKVRMYDTLQKIASRIIGDAARWIDIAIYNNLNPPYIVNYREISGSQRATGTATLYTPVPPLFDIFIPEGTPVVTDPRSNSSVFSEASGDFQFRYLTQEDVVLTPTEYSKYVSVEAEETGEGYNIFTNKLSYVEGDYYESLGVLARNETPFATGETRRVVVPGEIIFIPIGMNVDTDTYRTNMEGANIPEVLQERVLGVDASLIHSGLYDVRSIDSIAGDFAVDSKGDLGLNAGVDNLAQATIHRLSTQRGSLMSNPGYGSLIPSMVGTASAASTTKMLGLEVRETLLQDPRVLGVEYINVTKGAGGSYIIYAEAKVIGREDPAVLNLVMPPPI